MYKELVSIVVTLYNKQDTLQSCISSIQDQTYKNLEIILVNDASTDMTLQLCEEIAIKDSRIVLVDKKNNEGLSSARATGVDISHGSWILFMDGDDRMFPDLIESLMLHSKHETDVDIVSCLRIFSETPESEKKPSRIGAYFVDAGRNAANRIYRDKWIDTTLVCKLYRKQFMDKFHLYHYKEKCPYMFLEDYLMTPVFFCYARRIVVVEDAFWVHREDCNSISRSGALSGWNYDHIEAGRIVVEFCRKNSLDRLLEKELSKYIAHLLRIWVLMDFSKIEKEKKKEIQNRIRFYYMHYRGMYKEMSEDNFIRKYIFLMFRYSKVVWSKMIKNLYYKQYKKHVKSGGMKT